MDVGNNRVGKHLLAMSVSPSKLQTGMYDVSFFILTHREYSAA